MVRFKIQRYIARGTAIAAGITALWAIIWEVLVKGNVEFVSVFAGSAAVITAAISALATLRSTELAEERLKPYPYPYIRPALSKYGVCYFEIRNVGETTAHDIYLEWTGKSVPERMMEDDTTPLVADGKENAIAILLPHENVSQPFGDPEDVIQQAKTKGSEWKGYVNFKNSLGAKYKIPFLIDTTSFRLNLHYDTEEIGMMNRLPMTVFPTNFLRIKDNDPQQVFDKINKQMVEFVKSLKLKQQANNKQ